ncbi:MAG: hypothetical protein H7A36_01495 [Chlamydiales bacterium]|nr:hypothetical protein [Chlamydiales bacterium]
MPKILFHTPVPDEYVHLIESEFSHYDIIRECSQESDWYGVEVIYGSELTEPQLELAPHLRWVHAPSNDLGNLCYDKIRERGSIMISTGLKQNVSNIAEFVMGSVLSFSKQFFLWPSVPHEPQEFWNWPLKETMWSVKGRTLLQIGLGRVGTEVTRLAQIFGMKTWGVGLKKTFHPHCHKTFATNNLHSLLPSADVTVLAFPSQGIKRVLLGKEELALLKPDSILIIIGSTQTIDTEALIPIAKSGRLRGILFDSFKKPPLRNSPLWNLPKTILTPNVAGYPESETDEENFAHFRRNLRSYLTGRVFEMKNVIQL